MLSSKNKVVIVSAILGLALTAIVTVLSTFVFSFFGEALPTLTAAGPLLALSVFFLKRQTKTDLTPLGVAVAILILAVVSVLEPWDLCKTLFSRIININHASDIGLLILFNTVCCIIQGVVISAVFLISYKLFDVFEKPNTRNIALYIVILLLSALLTAGTSTLIEANTAIQVAVRIEVLLIFFIAFCPNAYMFMAATDRENNHIFNESEQFFE